MVFVRDMLEGKVYLVDGQAKTLISKTMSGSGGSGSQEPYYTLLFEGGTTKTNQDWQTDFKLIEEFKFKKGNFYESDGTFVGSFDEMRSFDGDGMVLYKFLKNGKPNIFTYKNGDTPIFKRLKTAKELILGNMYRFFPINEKSKIIGVYQGIGSDNSLLFDYNHKKNELYDVDESNPLLFNEIENLQIGGKRRKSIRKRTKRKRKTRTRN
jgi:hypothetical protein